MDKCKKCGNLINERYTYCRECFYELGCPKDTVVNKIHHCRKCGATITGKYNYCASCAKILFANNIMWKKSTR